MQPILLLKSVRFIFYLFLFNGLIHTSLYSQHTALETARQYAIKGDHVQADLQLSLLLQEHSGWTPARILKGHNYSWWKKYDQAIATFDQLTKEQPELTEAWIGLGYSYLWSGSSPNAVYPFRKALAIAPDNKDAQKGLGYVYLASENGEGAFHIFSKLSRAEPENTEFLVALGRALVLNGQRRAAQETFRQALELDPLHEDAKYYLALMQANRQLINIDIWGGFSDVNDDTRIGLRQLQLSYQPDKRYTVYAKYDNSLSLDNIEFITLREDADAISLGGLAGWNDRLASRLEYGLRFFPNGTQHLYKAEQVYYFPSSAYSIKAGGYLGTSADRPTEWYAYGGVHIPIGNLFSLDPTYFYGRNEGEAEAQHRFLLAGKVNFNTGYEVGAGAYYGNSNIETQFNSQNVRGGYLQSLFPIYDFLYGQLAINYEKNPFQDILVGAAGIQMRFRQ